MKKELSIQFLVVGKEEKISKVTETSLIEFSNIKVTYIQQIDDNSIYSIHSKEFTGDYICIVPNGSEVNSNAVNIFKKYCRDEKAVYLPLVVLTGEKAKGVLNNSLWNINLTPEIGILDNELALKQIDTTLFGAFIPVELLKNEGNYNKELKYYQHFHFLNKVTQTEKVIGIPKTFLFTDIDLTFSHVEEQEKVKNFKLAQTI